MTEVPSLGSIFGTTILDASGQPFIVVEIHKLIWTLVNNITDGRPLVVAPFESGTVGPRGIRGSDPSGAGAGIDACAAGVCRRVRSRHSGGRRILSRNPGCECPDGQCGGECGEVRFRHPASCKLLGGRRTAVAAVPAPRLRGA